MTNLKNKLNPLTWNVAIVDRLGMPTQEFMRKWAQQIQTNKSIIDLTKAAGVSDVLDLIGSTKGDLLYRTAADWEALAPGATNTILSIIAGVPAWVVPTANPTGTGSDVATNGTATTFMRSDATFAIQKTSSSVFGLCKVDGTTITATAGVISSTGGATGANPTATAGPTAVNGSAATFMRSDGAPAVQLTTSGQKGICQADGTTITVASGVISAVQPAGANPTATAGPTAVNGSAATFMRSDGAPAIQKGSSSQFGIVEVDNSTIVAASGVISIPSSVALPGSPTTTTQASNDSSTKVATTAFVQAAATAGFVPTGAAAHPGYISGKVYGPVGGVTGASRTFATGVLDCVLIYVPVTTVFTAISVNLASNSSVTSIDFGVYANTNGFPGALIQNIGTLVVTSTGVKSKSASISLAPGWYWLGVWMNGTAGVTALSALTSGLLGQTNAQTPLGNNMATQTIAYSAGNLPNPFAGALAGQNITNICLTAP